MAVARKLVAYLLAVDRSGRPFVAECPAVEPAQPAESAPTAAAA
jgi:hypothetical protein